MTWWEINNILIVEVISGVINMTIKELKAIIRKLDKNTVVKVNGKDVKVEISVNQDGQWFINLIDKSTIEKNSTIPAASGDSPKLER